MFSKSLLEIQSNNNLRWLGFLQTLCHVVTFFFVMPNAVFKMANSVNAQCWQYFPDCEVLHFPSKIFWLIYFILYLILSVTTATAFYQNKIRHAYYLLATTTALKIFFLVVDRSFMGNYHFMHILYGMIYLFFPKKQIGLKVLLVWFYLAAGILKLNMEWLSGASLGFSFYFLPAALQFVPFAYVVILELLFSWGLFSNNKWIRWSVFLQFVIFHLVSYYWVGYYYPSIMLALLMVFPLSWLSQKRDDPPGKSAIILVSILSLFQIYSHFGKEDPALYTYRRPISMNMFDARSVCTNNFYIHQNNKTVVYNPNLKYLGPRVWCDHGLLLNQAKNICQEKKSDPKFQSMDIVLLSKRTTDIQFQEVLNIRDVCTVISRTSYLSWLRGEL